jgi:hypothetical protein
MPVALDDESEPEPDLAVVPGTWASYRAGHPSRPALVVEVAESSLAFDRGDKGSLYARNGARDYWISTSSIGRSRYTHPAGRRRYGWRYGRSMAGSGGRRLTARAAAVRIAVSDLLPCAITLL